jgi:glycosyltransferase involved in cell wall biosynthesis
MRVLETPPGPTAASDGTPAARGGDPRRLAILPAYNEAVTVAGVVQSLRRHAPEWDAVVIDDGSTDDTAQLAEQAGAKVLHAPFNLGIGGAVQLGFVYALENRYDYMVQVDADGQHDPRDIRKLVAEMESHPKLDVICGSRFLTKDHRYPAPISRRTGIHLFAFLTSKIVGQRVSDPTSGFRLYNRRAIALFARDYPHDYPEVEAVLLLHHHRLRMREVPVRMFPREGGSSSINSGKSVYYMVKVLLAISVGLARRRPGIEPGDEAPVTATHSI